MSQSTLYRIAAAGLVVGAAIVALASLVSPIQTSDVKSAVDSPWFYPSTIGSIVGGVAIVLCVLAVFVRQRESNAVLGLIGAVLVAAAGMALTVGINLFQLIAIPWLVELHLTAAQVRVGPPAFDLFYPIASIIVTVGGLLLGIAIIRARVLGRAAGIALVGGAVLSLVLGALPVSGILGSIGEVAYMVALMWCGVSLWRSVRPLGIASRSTVSEVA